MTTEPRVHPMKEARTVGLPAYSIPVEWLPVRVGPWEEDRVPGDPCGWWLCENEHVGGGPGKNKEVHIRYCSLPYGHDGDCVWQSPTPKMRR